MSAKSVSHGRSSFTPYHDYEQPQYPSLFSRLSLNDRNSLQNAQSSHHQQDEQKVFDRMSVRSKRRKGSAQNILQSSIFGNNSHLKAPFKGKNSIVYSRLFPNDHEYYQDPCLGQKDDQYKSQFSQKSCPVGPSYKAEDQSEQLKRLRQIESQIKPRYHQTKNLLRTISNYLQKFILHNKRSRLLKQRYFRKVLMRRRERQENEQKMSILAFSKIKIAEDSENFDLQKSKDVDTDKITHPIVQKHRKIKKKVFRHNYKSQEQKSQKSKEQLQIQKKENNRKNKLLDQQVEQKIQEFTEWISMLSLNNFTDYQRIWTDSHEFTPLYRQFCYIYYRQEVYCDIMRRSRLQLNTKKITNQYMCQFIEGLFRPSNFCKFKDD